MTTRDEIEKQAIIKRIAALIRGLLPTVVSCEYNAHNTGSAANKLESMELSCVWEDLHFQVGVNSRLNVSVSIYFEDYQVVASWPSSTWNMNEVCIYRVLINHVADFVVQVQAILDDLKANKSPW